jgi:hypothetical protein
MQNTAPIQFRQVRDLGQIVSTTFTFIKQNWRPLFRAIAMLCMPFAIAGGFLAGSSLSGFQQMGMQAESDPFQAFIPGYVLLFIGFMLLSSLVHEYLRAYHLGLHQTMTSGELIKGAIGQIGPYMGASLLTWLLCFVGLLLFIFPFFYAWGVLSLALAAHAFERTGGAEAITRSYNLVKGDFWPTLGLLFVIGIIQYLLMYVVQLPTVIVSLTVGINTGLEMIQNDGTPTGFPSWYNMFFSFATALQWCAMMLVYTVVATCMTLKYFSRVEEREGHGLKEKIAGFEQA